MPSTAFLSPTAPSGLLHSTGAHLSRGPCFISHCTLSLFSMQENGEFLIDLQALIQETVLSASAEPQNLAMDYIMCTGKAISMPFSSQCVD